MPDVDRKHILHILKKHKRSSKRKVQVSNEQSKSMEVTTSDSSFNSKNSKTSHSSVNKDWENWVLVHDKKCC
jgi:septum formation topological specificity factor MinE